MHARVPPWRMLRRFYRGSIISDGLSRPGRMAPWRTVCSFLMSSSKLTVPGRAAVTRSYMEEVDQSGDTCVTRRRIGWVLRHRGGCILVRFLSICIGNGRWYRYTRTEVQDLSWLGRTPRPGVTASVLRSQLRREERDAHRSHEFHGRHFRSLHAHVLLLYLGNFVGELYVVRSTVLAGFGFRLSEESDDNGQHG